MGSGKEIWNQSRIICNVQTVYISLDPGSSPINAKLLVSLKGKSNRAGVLQPPVGYWERFSSCRDDAKSKFYIVLSGRTGRINNVPVAKATGYNTKPLRGYLSLENNLGLMGSSSG